MTAPKSSLRALSKLPSKQLRRSMHMTGPATFSSIALTERSTSRLTKDIVESAKRPEASDSPALSSIKSRKFNTSRSLKAVNDTSTMDFAYFPRVLASDSSLPAMRVPLLPTNFYPPRTGAHAPESAPAPVMRAEISTASADSTHFSAPSAFADVHDNAAMDIDFHMMAEKISAAASSLTSAAEPRDEQGFVKKVWSGLLDDMFGPKQKTPAST